MSAPPPEQPVAVTPATPTPFQNAPVVGPVLRGEAKQTEAATEAGRPTRLGTVGRTILLFVMIVLGVLSNWFLGLVGPYLADPSQGFPFIPPLAAGVRILVSIIISFLVFAGAYTQINRNAQESFVWALFLAFQNGFFWQALLGDLTGGGGQSGNTTN